MQPLSLPDPTAAPVRLLAHKVAPTSQLAAPPLVHTPAQAPPLVPAIRAKARHARPIPRRATHAHRAQAPNTSVRKARRTAGRLQQEPADPPTREAITAAARLQGAIPHREATTAAAQAAAVAVPAVAIVEAAGAQAAEAATAQAVEAVRVEVEEDNFSRNP